MSSKRWTRNASLASWRAWIAWLCHRSSSPTRSGRISIAISRTSRAKGSLRIRRSVDCWYRRISRSATVPGLYRRGLDSGTGSPAVIMQVSSGRYYTRAFGEGKHIRWARGRLPFVRGDALILCPCPRLGVEGVFRTCFVSAIFFYTQCSGGHWRAIIQGDWSGIESGCSMVGFASRDVGLRKVGGPLLMGCVNGKRNARVYVIRLR